MLSGYEMNTFTHYYTWNNLIIDKLALGAYLFAFLQVSGFILLFIELVVLFLKEWRHYILEYKRFLIFLASLIVVISTVYMFSSVRPGEHAIISLYPLSFMYFFWFLNYFKNKLKYTLVTVYAISVFSYYILVIHVTNILPSLGYRQKAFKAIEKKEASIFESPRYPDKPKPIR